MYMKEYASDQSRMLVGDLSKRIVAKFKKKKRTAFKTWTAVLHVEKYKIGATVHILETIAFFFYIFRDDSFTRGQSKMRRIIYESSATNISDW